MKFLYNSNRARQYIAPAQAMLPLGSSLGTAPLVAGAQEILPGHQSKKLRASDIPDFKSLKELRRAGWAIHSTTYRN